MLIFSAFEKGEFLGGFLRDGKNSFPFFTLQDINDTFTRIEKCKAYKKFYHDHTWFDFYFDDPDYWVLLDAQDVVCEGKFVISFSESQIVACHIHYDNFKQELSNRGYEITIDQTGFSEPELKTWVRNLKERRKQSTTPSHSMPIKILCKPVT
jgi:hypothetical protein